MRLTSAQVNSIMQVAAEVMGAQVRVILFGSRVDDTSPIVAIAHATGAQIN